MVTPAHVTRGIALINFDKPSFRKDPLLLAEDGNMYITYSVKETESNKHRTTNKFFSHHFLEIWKLNTPKMATLHAPPSIFNGLKQNHLFNKTPISTGKVCLGFKLQKEEILFNPLLDDVHYWSFKSFSNSQDFLRMALFDGWIGNNGRKNTGLDLFFITDKHNKLQLYSRNHEWTFGDIPYEFLSKNYRDNTHFSILELKIVRKIISMYDLDTLKNSLYFYYKESIKKTLDSFEAILKVLPDNFRVSANDKKNIAAFLGNADRNERVFEEFLAIVRP